MDRGPKVSRGSRDSRILGFGEGSSRLGLGFRVKGLGFRAPHQRHHTSIFAAEIPNAKPSTPCITNVFKKRARKAYTYICLYNSCTYSHIDVRVCVYR